MHVLQTDNQNTQPPALTEIKSNLCEKAEIFFLFLPSITEMRHDFVFHPIEPSYGTEEMCLKYTALLGFFSFFLIFLRDSTSTL